jgi:flagellar FliL protein
MQHSVGVSLRKLLAFLFLSLSLAAVNAHASEGGGGEGGGGAYTKLEPFTVNLVGLTQVIQLVVTLKMAKPEAGEKVKLFMPAVRHNMILLLSSKSAEQVSSAAGKQQLMKETISAVNRAIESNAKEGVADALFESIIIQ